MKKLELDIDGRPATNDDFDTLQTEGFAATFGPYSGRGAFIVSGCQVSGSSPTYTISAGLVMLDGEFLRFYGASGVSLPMQFQRGGYAALQQRTYESNALKTCISEWVAVLVADNPLRHWRVPPGH